jgi:hypothetical protein
VRPHGQTTVPEIAYDSAATPLKMPAEIHLGEVAGVATDSKGQVFVYTRTGNPTVGLGNSRLFTHGGSRLFQFDPRGNYVREIGQGVYAFLVAHSVRLMRRTTSGSWMKARARSSSSARTGGCS